MHRAVFCELVKQQQVFFGTCAEGEMHVMSFFAEGFPKKGKGSDADTASGEQYVGAGRGGDVETIAERKYDTICLSYFRINQAVGASSGIPHKEPDLVGVVVCHTYRYGAAQVCGGGVGDVYLRKLSGGNSGRECALRRGKFDKGVGRCWMRYLAHLHCEVVFHCGAFDFRLQI